MIYKNILWLLVSVSCFVGAALTACDDNDDSVVPTVNPPTDTTVHDSSVLDEAIRLDSLDLTMTERYGSPMYFYAQVDKSGDYFRRMFMDTTSFTVAAATGEIPDGAIIAMETWANESNQSTVFYRAKQDGQWLNGSFSPNRPDFSDAIDINSCRNCHQTASTTDFTFTRPLIQRSVRENTVQFIECDRGPTGPCDLEVYFKMNRVLIIGGLIAGLLLGCQEEEPEAQPMITDTELFFTEEVTPIFLQNCNYCHSMELATAGIVLDTYEDAQVVAQNGQLLGAVTHAPGYTPMPLNAPQLPDEEITTIRRWVKAELSN